MSNWSKRFHAIGRRVSPQQALVFSFAVLILVGAGLLLLPGMTEEPEGLSVVDALFTATSAVCVTGLIVVDTGTAFTLTGQLVILGMIQLGGLGIMTFSIFFLRLAGIGSSLKSELAVRSSLSLSPQHDIFNLVKSVVLFTLIFEAVGALLLTVAFAFEYSPFQAFYLAVFHAISAFCNAGFSLFSDSLTRFQENVWVNLVVMTLIVSGGLGFIVMVELTGLRPKKRIRLSLHSKIVIVTSMVLVFYGAVVFWVLEWHNVLGGMGLPGKIVTGLFQSVTTRTAGFNTVNFDHMTNTSLVTAIFLMFVGGSPGSTAGGIKTITLAVVVAMVVSRFRGFSRANLFRRSITETTIARCAAVVLIGLAVVGIAFSLLLITQTGEIDHTRTRDTFLQLLFETVSAFGTVGLSMGVTGQLTSLGKVIIILTMFLGRVGPITVGLAMMSPPGSEKRYNYGSEEIIVG